MRHDPLTLSVQLRVALAEDGRPKCSEGALDRDNALAGSDAH